MNINTLIRRLKFDLIDGTPFMKTMDDAAEEIVRLRCVLRRIVDARGDEANVEQFQRIAKSGVLGYHPPAAPRLDAPNPLPKHL